MHFLLLWKKHPEETTMSDMKEIHKTIFNNPSSVATTINIEYRSGEIRTSFH
jgi:uncharacterized protein YqgV (UPF0045/DUF77 family)